ncbi:hypothetical protein [Leptospira alstonii]|uniref:Uncharacterized protein n=2 Tax=Leptospira alstonii TaxID=28452 RepID=M6D0S4_9LEPT|nr:hypothetical protein [Leptospira alstonii]EMJ96296.1 hypothetical protein LEP1GSC194_3781 [Leptospira alstonii serovar Sichuan str. 79601]EQA78964.1 hypothetical protein LEP1GSC193_0233 [Leptospira alstonii serovar Pingchang str. 80-412]
MELVASSAQGKKSVLSLAKRFSLRYEHRPAMLDELKKGKFL